MRRSATLLAALGLFVSPHVLGQALNQLPPIAQPAPELGMKPPAVERYQPLPPSGQVKALPLPPSAGVPVHPGDARDAPWRVVIEQEFRAMWEQQGCLPHPQRHGAWFYGFADRLGASTEPQRRLLYDLVMERASAYEAPFSPPERIVRDARRWFGGLAGRPEGSGAAEVFCR